MPGITLNDVESFVLRVTVRLMDGVQNVNLNHASHWLVGEYFIGVVEDNDEPVDKKLTIT